MSAFYQLQDPSLESQWRALILFGKNSATYKFAFAQALLELVGAEATTVSLAELAEPFARHVVRHLQQQDKQGSAATSKFLTACRHFLTQQLSHADLLTQTEKLGFVHVVDAFQVVNSARVPRPFYEKHVVNGKPHLVLTDHLLQLKDSRHFASLAQEADARWQLVETAWNLRVPAQLLEVQYDESQALFFIERHLARRVNITAVRAALNGYQKGKCFYSFLDISVQPHAADLCQVDHFFPHLYKQAHLPANLDGVWNLVLADRAVNNGKSARVPEVRFLARLYQRNEFLIASKHPLAETIVNQTGATPAARQQFLRQQYQLALNHALHCWAPAIELPPTF